MAKKKLKQKKKKVEKKATKKKAKKKLPEEKKVKDLTIEIRQRQSDVKTFLEKFRADVSKKRETYQSAAQKFQKKKL